MSNTAQHEQDVWPSTLNGLEVGIVAGTLGQGGAERQLYYMVQALIRSHARVHVLSLTEGEHYESPLKTLGAKLTWVGKSTNKLFRLLRILKTLRTLKPQVLQSQHFYTNLYVALAGRWLKIPHLGSMRSTGKNEVAAAGKLLGTLSLKKPAALLANSKVAIQYAMEQGLSPDRLHHVPNVIDTSVFQASFRQPRSTLRLIAVGRLGPEKRFDRFLRVVAALKQEIAQPLEAWIVGSGPLRAQLEQQVWDLGLTGSVRFRGSIEDMMLIYPEADVLVLTSDWEGTPNVLIEAMATGLPVVATRVGGVPDVIADGRTGFLVDAADEAGMVQSLQLLAGSAELRSSMGEAGTRWVQEHYSLQRLPQILAQVYFDVMQKQIQSKA